jgi:chromosome segregation ATPase
MAVTTVTEEDSGGTMLHPTPSRRQYVTPMSRSGSTGTSSAGILTIAQTPIEDAVKLEGAEFEQIMKERARMRRAKEDSYVAELRVKVSRLEQALAAETKRRVEAMRSLERQAKEEIQHWEERQLNELKEQREIFEDRMGKLEERFNQLEERWKKESEQQKQQVNRKGEEFQAALDELRKEAETERKLRLVREGQFLQQIESHEKDYEELWNKERQERIESVGELVNQLESNEETRKDARKAVEVRLEHELAQLQRELQQETEERKKRDNEISTALDRYTYLFQQNLNILNDDEDFDEEQYDAD